MDVVHRPSFHDGNASACASADIGRSGPIRTGSEAKAESRMRRLTLKEVCGVVMFDPSVAEDRKL